MLISHPSLQALGKMAWHEKGVSPSEKRIGPGGEWTQERLPAHHQNVMTVPNLRPVNTDDTPRHKEQQHQQQQQQPPAPRQEVPLDLPEDESLPGTADVDEYIERETIDLPINPPFSKSTD